MAINVSRTLGELAHEAENLGITVTPSGKKIGKTDYVLALRDFYLHQQYPDGNIPKHLQLILNYESPQLCCQYKDLKPAEEAEVWNDNNKWVAEQKEDGCRMLIVYTKGEGFHFYTRNISVKDFLPEEYSSKIYLPNLNTNLDHDFIIDSEIICTNSSISTKLNDKKGVITECQLQAVTALLALNSVESLEIQKNENCPLEFHVFDILYFDKNLTDLPLVKRIDYFKLGLAELNKSNILYRRVYSTMVNKKAFYLNIIKNGGEGIILKDLTQPYLSTNLRHSNWVKVKRTLSEMSGIEGMNDTIDAWVTGWKPATEGKGHDGQIGALILSTNILREDGTSYVHEIAYCPNLTDAERERISVKDSEGKLALLPEMYGKVFEVDGQAITARSLRLKHPRIIRPRPDKSPDACSITEVFLKSQVL